jgi:hypothetical protein
MNLNPSPSKRRHYAPDVVLLCARWCCRFQPAKIFFATRPLREPAQGEQVVLFVYGETSTPF